MTADDEDARFLARAVALSRSRMEAGHGVGVCHCAASNMVLAPGICRTVELAAAGVKVGLGVDGSASNDASNMMDALRQALLLGRLRHGADRVAHRDVIRWGTEGSARCLGRDDVGRLAPGPQADLALFILDEPRFAGAHDPVAALVPCNAQRADGVMVGGRWRVEDGQPVGLDLAKTVADQRQAARRFACWRFPPHVGREWNAQVGGSTWGPRRTPSPPKPGGAISRSTTRPWRSRSTRNRRRAAFRSTGFATTSWRTRSI